MNIISVSESLQHTLGIMIDRRHSPPATTTATTTTMADTCNGINCSQSQSFAMLLIALVPLAIIYAPIIASCSPAQAHARLRHFHATGYDFSLDSSNVSITFTKRPSHERNLALQSGNYVINDDVGPPVTGPPQPVAVFGSRHPEDAGHASLGRHPPRLALFHHTTPRKQQLLIPSPNQQHQPASFVSDGLRELRNQDTPWVQSSPYMDRNPVIEQDNKPADGDYDDAGNQSTNQSSPHIASATSRSLSGVASGQTVPASKLKLRQPHASSAGKIMAHRLGQVELPSGYRNRHSMTDDPEYINSKINGDKMVEKTSHDANERGVSAMGQSPFRGNSGADLLRPSSGHHPPQHGTTSVVTSTVGRSKISVPRSNKCTADQTDCESKLAESEGHLSGIAADPNDNRFSESDDFFLMEDYRSRPMRGRQLRSYAPIGEESMFDPITSDKISHAQTTIYFGGFFPWLAEKQIQTESLLSSISGRSAPYTPNEYRLNGFNNPSPKHIMKHSDGIFDYRKNEIPGSDLAEIGQINEHKQQQQQQQQSMTQQPSTSAMQYTNSETRHQLGKFILPAVRLALDHINTNRSILSAYRLEVVPRDTQCNATISLKQFFDMVYEAPKKMLLYGDACRVSTDPIAKASYFFDLIQISYADTDPIYTIENYPNFFRVVPSENALSLARIPFIRHFNWTRVGTIYQNLPRYSLPHSKLLTDLERFNIVIKQSVSLPGSVDGLQNRDLGDELRKLKEKDVRIILGNFDEEWALLLFCEAYREKMTGRKYQWLLTGFSEAKLWHFYQSKGSSCSKQELLLAMDGYIITDITPVTRSQHRTISGLMAHEYLSQYQRRAREMSISIEENKFYGYVYDGIWAIALALDRVDRLLRYYSRLAREGKVRLKPEFNEIHSLLDFEYHKPVWVRLIRDALNATRFEGVTGTVSFQRNERPGLVTFSQFQAFRDVNEVIIGSYDALKEQLDLSVGFPIIWRGSSPPIDYTIQRVMPFRINRTLFVIISILALVGIVLACVFLFVNIKFRNQRYIKMSSPYLNNLIIIGCILTFTSVIILGLDSGLTSENNFPYICNARAWVLMAGFTLAFGSMFSKTFRVHSIFTNIKLHKKVIKDYKLFMVVFILLTFDVCILIVWQYFDPFYRETNNGTSIQDPDNEDVIIVPEMEHCQSKRMTIFLSVIYVYKGLLMAFGCFLAWETRHVSIPALNDSKYIGLSVYNVVIMCVIGASLSFILRDQQDASFVIISIFIIFCSTTTLCLVFVPKLIELKQNPRAGDHRVRATLKTFKKNYHDEAFAAGCRDIHGNIIGRAYGMNLNDRIKLLVDENSKQRTVLKEKTYELEALTSKYKKIQSMVQSGQFLQAINTSAGATASITSTMAGRPPVPNMVQSSSAGLFPNPTGMGSLATPTTTAVLLTSRSPTRERVSFSSAVCNVDQLLPSAGQQPVVASTTELARDASCATNEPTTGGTRSSQMMSFATQITNTTSSTINNATELTADFSFNSKTLASGATTSSGITCGPAQHSHDKSPITETTTTTTTTTSDDAEACNLGERVQAISRQVAASRQQQRQQRQQSAIAPMKSDERLHHYHKVANVDGRALCGDEKQSLFRSQDDLSLFTILSHARGSQTGGRAYTTAGGRGHRQTDEDQCAKLGRWLEGPFCTVLLRQTSLDYKRRNTSSSRGCCGVNASLTSTSVQAFVERDRSARFRKQHSHQAVSTSPMMPPTKTLLNKNVRNRLPRTLSMIEYLGLNDFDMIARRHDKILRYKRRMMARSSCCASCSCCISMSHLQSNPNFQDNKCHSQSMLDDSTNNNNHNYYSSSDDVPYNYSDDFLQTASLISCSTCCSLASQTFASNSELDYRSHYRHNNNNNNNNNSHHQHQHHHQARQHSQHPHQLAHGHHMHHHHTNHSDENNELNSISGSSTATSTSSGALGLGSRSSSSLSSSKSESLSIVIGGGDGGGSNRTCTDQRFDPHSDGGNSSSRSSSMLVYNRKTNPECPIHKQRALQSQDRNDLAKQPPFAATAASCRSSICASSSQMVTDASSSQLNHQPLSTGCLGQAGGGSQMLASDEEAQSLCTSGLLYGAPGTKEDANEAVAHTVARCIESSCSAATTNASISLTPIETLGSSNAPNNTSNACETAAAGAAAGGAQACQSAPNISIECDIVEEL